MPIQCPIEDTTERGGLFAILREYLKHGQVLLKDQIQNLLQLGKEKV
jgi:hypothetical protein